MRYLALLTLCCLMAQSALAGPIRLHAKGSRDLPTSEAAVALFHEICISAGPVFEDSVRELRDREIPEHEGRHFEIKEWEINFFIGGDFSFLTEKSERVCTMTFTSLDDRATFVDAVKARYGDQGRFGLFVSEEFGKPIALEISFNESDGQSRHQIKAYEYMLVS